MAHVALTAEIFFFNFSVIKKKSLGIPQRRMVCNVSADWIYPSKERYQWEIVLNMIRASPFIKTGNFMTTSDIFTFSRTPYHKHR
jgi:hypothetical protein